MYSQLESNHAENAGGWSVMLSAFERGSPDTEIYLRPLCLKKPLVAYNTGAITYLDCSINSQPVSVYRRICYSKRKTWMIRDC